ncbi:MAG TPA: 2OG-Fe dioxygenase family protein [Stellaceae bacterium]|nr:2OG-Fe dioxygenase family protein [Stellaceae bacterium]
MKNAAISNDAELAERLGRDGYAFLAANEMRALLSAAGPLADWERFARSWDDMPVDPYMADGGRYRRRRYAVFAARADGLITRAPHQPHYQSLDYNPLHGGIERWFEPIGEEIAAGAALTTILAFCRRLFERLASGVRAWHIEAHQFRIEAASGAAGKPTPEGMHRDGVDYVLVLLIRRQNIRRGTTSIHDLARHRLGSFTLTDPFDAALVHDAKVYHGVTPVEPKDPTLPAFRDVLVVTFKRQ